MTNEEIINRLQYKSENIKARLEPEYFSECAEYLERYRWHDLRKDPNDLPNELTNVIVYTFDGYYVAYRDKNNWIESGLDVWLGCVVDVDVKAWREIEPFEEEQNEN